MLDLLNKTDTETAITTAAKRDRIEAELRADASRSDRKIAEIVGCDHKTVGAARARLGNSVSPDIDLQESQGAQVAAAPAPGVVDKPDGNWYWPIPRQYAIECRAITDGSVEIWQEGQHSPEEDVTIQIAAGNAVMLARHILYAAGFSNIGIYIHVRGEGNVDLENGDMAETFKDADKPKPSY